MEQELISGTIAAVVYQNQLNGYAVIKMESEDGGMITVVGVIPSAIAGERLIVTGKWVQHSTYGKQFEAEFLERLLPDTCNDILSYLSSRAVKGIGPKTAEKIVGKFGENSLKILDRSPERLAEISGISVKAALEMGEAFRRQVGLRRLIEFLSAYRIPASIAVRLYRVYGEKSGELVQENPYLLTQPQFGATFSQVDEMALQIGFDAGDDCRVEAAVIFELRHNLNNGHSFLPLDKLVLATAQMLELDVGIIASALTRLTEFGSVEVDTIAGLQAVYLPEYYEAEAYITERIIQMAHSPIKVLPEGERFLQTIERNKSIRYAHMQKEAILAAAARRAMILTGGPGTGKTTTLSGILELFDLLGRKTLLAAPTGRAAKRLSELTGREASTIHRLLETQISPENGEMYFAKGENDPLDCDALIVDEMSMVDLLLMHSLLLALPAKACLILVGDPDQLPSVGAGNLFGDLIRSGAVCSIRLTEIFRQARESMIVMNAHAVNQGQLPVLNVKDRDFFFMRRHDPNQLVQTVCDLCARRLPENMGIPAPEIQVISPTKKGQCGTVNLNRMLQAALNPQSPMKKEAFFGENCFREGDRVMQIRNNYDIIWKKADGSVGMGVFNGDIGQIRRIDHAEGLLEVCFDDKVVSYQTDLLGELELAYAITAHKSQGSEYRAVIFVPFAGAPMLLTRGVLYTAMTRARELMVMVGNEEVIAAMTENNRRNKRYCGLRHRLLEKLGV